MIQVKAAESYGPFLLLAANENFLFIPHIEGDFWSWVGKGLWPGLTSVWALGIKV